MKRSYMALMSLSEAKYFKFLSVVMPSVSLEISQQDNHFKPYGPRMANYVAIIGTDTVTCDSATSSPENLVKFLCSHGGKILPRPPDGQLKYVGGETRVVSVPRDISFQELMKRLTYSIDGETTLKYQILSQDLDMLVSVKSDEDVQYMFDEIDHYESMEAPRLRAFLFPANPIVVEIHSVDRHVYEQRYIDAINGIIRPGPLCTNHSSTINTVQHGSLPSSASSSPRSPESYTAEAMNESSYLMNRLGMHKVQSLPSLCAPGSPQQSYCQNIHSIYPQYYYRSRMVGDHCKSVGPERLTSVRSVGRAEGVRYQMEPASQYYYLGSSSIMDRRMFNIKGSPANSPSGLGMMRAWDGTIGH